MTLSVPKSVWRCPLIHCIHMKLSCSWNFLSDNFLLPRVPHATHAKECALHIMYHLPWMVHPPNLTRAGPASATVSEIYLAGHLFKNSAPGIRSRALQIRSCALQIRSCDTGHHFVTLELGLGDTNLLLP